MSHDQHTEPDADELAEQQENEWGAWASAQDADAAADAVRQLPTAGSPNPRGQRLSHFPGADPLPF